MYRAVASNFVTTRIWIKAFEHIFRSKIVSIFVRNREKHEFNNVKCKLMSFMYFAKIIWDYF